MVWLDLLLTFVMGGVICLIGQILIIRTKMTSARILVLFLIIGCVLEAFNLYKPLFGIFGSGVAVPIVGFGALLTEGAIAGARSGGFMGLVAGALKASAAGLTVAIVSAFFMALLFKSKTKND